MLTANPLISIVIPVGPGDQSWLGLLAQLARLENPFEIILAVSNEASEAECSLYKQASGNLLVTVVSSEPGRGRQLNSGAAAAKGAFLWFVHSDTTLTSKALARAKAKAQLAKPALYYFDLLFDDQADYLMMINTIGVFFRSRLFRLPFGDQGFLVDAKTFMSLGGFSCNCCYGEDHLFVWQCHQTGIPVKAIGYYLRTSSRKYQTAGWSQTTGEHLSKTWHQAYPELKKMVKKRWLQIE